ncbi:MAG: serine hydrolase domain-containing protein, partial [bacterium]
MYKNSFGKFQLTMKHLVMTIGLFLTISPAFSQEMLALLKKYDATDQPGEHPTSLLDLEKFTNDFFKEQMKKHHVPGAVVLIVKGDQIVFKKGYGVTNIENPKPVDPDETLLKVGSITKLFTTAAILQLAEKGLLNLDDDVNLYLKQFKIRNPFPDPVTIKRLLTHTAGFDHKHIGLYTKTKEQLQPLGDYLKEHMPRLVSNPGEFVSYSNYGISLAGFLIEEITKTPYDLYIKKNILEPLAMSHTGFIHEINEQSNRATGYRFTPNGFKAIPNEFFNLIPSGALMSTASDMAQFMIAHLQNGRLGDTYILNPETVAEMHRTQFRVHPKMSGWCYGFYESFYGTKRAIMHSGHPKGFSNLLFLLKEENLGLFIAYNSNDATLYRHYIKQLLNRYFPMTKEPVFHQPADDFKQRAHRFTGTYQFHSTPQRTISKLRDLLERKSEVTVTDNFDGTLAVHMPKKTFRIVEIEPLLFQDQKEKKIFAFKADDSGNITHLFVNGEKPQTLEKLQWWEKFGFQLNLIRGFFLFFSGSLLLLMLYYSDTEKSLNRLVSLSGLNCFLNIVFLFGVNSAYSSLELRYGIPVVMVALLCIPLLSSLLSLSL